MNKIFAWLSTRLRAGRTIRVKLTLSLMLAAALPLIAVGVLFILVNTRLAQRDMGNSLSTLADIMGANSSAALAFDDAKAARETLASLKQDPAIAAACIYRKNGAVFAAYTAEGEPSFIPPAPAADGDRITDRYMTASRRIFDGQALIGTVF